MSANTDAPAKSLAKTWFINGTILTYEGTKVRAREALGVQGDRIVFVGDTEEARAKFSQEDTIHDLDGLVMMPGIHDAHMHGKNRSVAGWVQSSCDLGYEGGTVEYVLGKLKAALLAESEREHLHSDYLFVAINLFAPALQPSGRLLTRDDLDRLSRDPSEDEFGTGTTRPIVVYDKGIHSNFANSQAIRNAGVEALGDDPGHIGRDENGRANGVFNDFPGDWGELPPVTGDMDIAQRLSDLREANSLGITSQFEAAGTLQSAEVWARIADRGLLTVRLNQSINVTEWIRGNSDTTSIREHLSRMQEVRDHYNGYPTGANPGSLTIDTVKVFADGEAEAPHQTAAMLRPYNENVGTTDAPVWQPSNRIGDDPSASDARIGFLALDAAEWNIHVHCLGDRATRETLDNFEAINTENASWNRRHTICHLEFVAKEDISRLARLGVIGNMSLQWAKRDAWTVDAYEGHIDADLLARAYPARELLDAGVVLSGGSDWPVDPLDPWLQIRLAVTREWDANPIRGIYAGAFAAEQAITVEEALIMHTLGGAVQMHQDDATGSIEVGKYADLIIIDRDPCAIPAHELSEVRVLATLVGGVTVHGEVPGLLAA